jgi:hypothetical protein
MGPDDAEAVIGRDKPHGRGTKSLGNGDWGEWTA